MPRLAKCSVSLWTMVTMKRLWGKCVQYFNRAPNNPKINQTSESLKLIETDVYRNTSQPRSLHSDVFCYVVSHVAAIYSTLTFMKSLFVLFCFHVFFKLLPGNWPTTWRTSVHWLLWPKISGFANRMNAVLTEASPVQISPRRGFSWDDLWRNVFFDASSAVFGWNPVDWRMFFFDFVGSWWSWISQSTAGSWLIDV